MLSLSGKPGVSARRQVVGVCGLLVITLTRHGPSRLCHAADYSLRSFVMFFSPPPSVLTFFLSANVPGASPNTPNQLMSAVRPIAIINRALSKYPSALRSFFRDQIRFWQTRSARFLSRPSRPTDLMCTPEHAFLLHKESLS